MKFQIKIYRVEVFYFKNQRFFKWFTVIYNYHRKANYKETLCLILFKNCEFAIEFFLINNDINYKNQFISNILIKKT